MLEEQPLNPDLHDRAGFSCGISELDDYLHRLSDQHRRKGVSTVYVLVDTEKPRVILGFYTLSAAQVDSAELRVELKYADRKKLPRYPIPCFRLGRLACRMDRPGIG